MLKHHSKELSNSLNELSDYTLTHWKIMAGNWLLKKILNQISLLIYLAKDIQKLSTFLPNLLLCMVDKNHK